MAVVKITHTNEIIVSIATNVLHWGRTRDTNNKDKGQIYNAKRRLQTEQITAQCLVMASLCAASDTVWDGVRGIPQEEEKTEQSKRLCGLVQGP